MAKQLSVKTREVYIGGNQRESLCDTFIYEPSNVEEEKLGNLYIAGQVYLKEDPKDESLIYLMNLLASVIKREYYANSKRPPLTSLEQALKKANVTLNELAEKGSTDWIGNLHLISGCLTGKILHLACSGNAKGILLRKGVLTDIGQIIPNLASEGMPFKTFTSVASGNLEEEDLIIFSTPTLWESISANELKDIIKSNTPIEEIHQRIQEVLSQDSDEKNTNLGAIILKIEPQKESLGLVVKAQERVYQSEVKQIQEQPETKKKIANEKQEATPQKEELAKIISRTLAVSQKFSLFLAKYLLKTIKFLGFLLLLGLQKLAVVLAINGLRTLRISSSFVKNKLTRQKIKSIKIKNLKENLTSEKLKALFKKVTRINHLPSSSKALLAISLVLAVLLSISLGVIYKKKIFEVNLKQYGGLLEEAHQKEDRAQAALIYQDEETARFLLIEAKQLVVTVLNSTDYFKDEGLSLLARLQEQERKVDKVTHLTQPKLVADFSENSDLHPQKLISLGNNLYIIGLQNSIYRLDLKNLSLSKPGINSTNVGYLKSGVASGDSITFYTDTPGIAIFESKKNAIRSVDTSKWRPPLGQNIKDIAGFNANIYLLDLEQNQILKSYKTLEGYNNPSWWLKEEANLENTSSIAIDGAVYLLKENGEILKYVRGKRVEFKNPKLFNPLKKTIKIFTTPSFGNLYIIDQEAKKIVILDKNGGLVKQYFSENFNDLKDIFISDDESKIFLLNGDKIYQIALN